MMSEAGAAVHRILLAVDESEGARRAADYVERVLSGPEVTVVALHVARRPGRLVPATWTGIFAWPVAASAGLAMRPADAGGSLDEVVDRAEVVAGAMTTLQAPAADHVGVAFGEPVAVISKVAEEEDVDLIVIGATGGGALRRLLHRSVPTALARRPPRPVLIVH